MTDNRDRHHRRSLRLAAYNYAAPGAYFITLCSWKRASLFGEIVGGEMQVNEFGRVTSACWGAIPRHFDAVTVDAFVVMPNHVHGVVFIGGQDHLIANDQQFGRPAAGSLSTIVRSFKSAVTKRVNELRNTPALPVWQRNYYEHVIRNDDELTRIREYVAPNPLAWELDRENPQGRPTPAQEAWQV
jgi:REP element-mobilizing transposase RayT